MEKASRRGADSTLISHAAQQTLRSDTTLGSGNFLDRALIVSSRPDDEFLWLDHATVLPDGSRYESFTLRTLDEARRRLAAWYLHHDTRPHDIVAVCVSGGIAPFLHYLALTSLGATAALVNPAMPCETLEEYLRHNRFERLTSDAQVLAKSRLREHVASLRPHCALLDASAPTPKAAAHALPTWWPYEHPDSGLVMLSHTSGTTGVPKTVQFEHRQFFMGKRARLGMFTEARDERFLSALPPSHSSAISHLETAILQGVPTMVVSDAVGAGVREALHAFRPTMVAAFPQTFAALLEEGVAPGEFCSVRRWFSMGDAAHESHIRRILVGSQGARFIDSYGSSELGMALFRSVSTRDAVAPRRSIGRPVDVAVAKVLEFHTELECQPGSVGLLAVRAPTITPGYWQSRDATAQSWRGGYFLTGDVGFCRDGEFYLIDRAVDVIASAAGPLYTLSLEEELQQVPGVCDASVVGSEKTEGEPQRVFALVLLDSDARAHAEHLGQRVWDVLHRAVQLSRGALPRDHVVVIVMKDRTFVPLGATGKVLKRRLSRELAALEGMPTDGTRHPEGVLYVTNGVREQGRTDVVARPSTTSASPSFA